MSEDESSNAPGTLEEELETMEEDTLDPGALGLHRVGTELPRRKIQHNEPPLNARGMPARIRKKNKLFYEDDDEEEVASESSKPSGGGGTPSKSLSSVSKKRRLNLSQGTIKIKRSASDLEEDDEDADVDEEAGGGSGTAGFLVDDGCLDMKANSTMVGWRLRNMLKLPKAHKFVSYEWFYSNLDRAVFGEENDFQTCLKELFPQLTCRLMSRVEWTRIRRIMGKPRRCSQAFLDEERRELERKRQKIRLLQSRKIADVSFVKDLPKEIPLPFALGTKVTARLRHPQDGLFSGIVAAVDPITHKYRVTFQRPGLGTHPVPDFELMAINENETIPLRSITQNFRKKRLQQSDNKLFAAPLTMSMAQKQDPILGADSAMTTHEATDELLLKGGDKDNKITVAGKFAACLRKEIREWPKLITTVFHIKLTIGIILKRHVIVNYCID